MLTPTSLRVRAQRRQQRLACPAGGAPRRCVTAAHRMIEGQARRVQRLAWETAAAPARSASSAPATSRRRPPYTGSPTIGKPACAPGARGSGGCARSRAGRAPACAPRKRSLDAVVGDRWAAIGAHRHAGALRAMPADRLIDRAAGGHARRCTQRQVVALDRARRSMAHQRRVRLRRARHHQQPARVLVEAVDRARRAAPGRARIERQQCVLQGVRGIAGPRVHHEARGLVDHQQRAVLEHDARAGSPRPPPAHPPRIRPDPHLLPAADLVLGRTGRPVHQHLARARSSVAAARANTGAGPRPGPASKRSAGGLGRAIRARGRGTLGGMASVGGASGNSLYWRSPL